MRKTILIMAGGTGGHVFPGLAVADHLRDLGWRVVWLGTRAGMEQNIVPKRGYDIELIDFSGLRGKRAMIWLTLPFRLIRAFMQSARVIRRIKPDVVLGMGGFPAFPGGMMASLLNKPLIIHEQNSILGLTNKVLAKVADKVFLGFPKAMQVDDNKVFFSGNPVRKEIAEIEVPEERYAGRAQQLRLLVVGGSLGAQVLNTVVPQAMQLLSEQKRPYVIHQAGEHHLAVLKKNYAELGVVGEQIAFIDDMAAKYANCDLVLCRAGALTIAELAAAGVPSILVPYPYAVDDHQTSNAKFLSEVGAAVLLPQNELNAQKLTQLLLSMTREKLLGMAVAARTQAKPGATVLVANACIQMSEA